MPSISIIILTYNSSQYIGNLLKSLHEFAGESEILVVDNASTDNTSEIIKKFENIKLLETGENLGFAKGINFGAKKANGDFLLFINPDAIFKSGKFSDMLEVFEKNKKVGVLGGKMLGKDGKAEKSAGKSFGLWQTILISFGLDEKLGGRFSPNKLSKVDFVSGGFMMVDASLFKELGGFDEKFFMYVEDMEFCYRVKKTRREVYFTPVVSIEHAGQGSSNREFAIVNIYRGLLYFHKKQKNALDYQIVRFVLHSKALLIYLLGRITNNSYYISTYAKALEVFK